MTDDPLTERVDQVVDAFERKLAEWLDNQPVIGQPINLTEVPEHFYDVVEQAYGERPSHAWFDGTLIHFEWYPACYYCDGMGV